MRGTPGLGTRDSVGTARGTSRSSRRRGGRPLSMGDVTESRVPSPESRAPNNFAFKMATVNGTGSASANSLLMQAIFRMGVPVTGKNLFPSNIQGLPTAYEIRVNKTGYTARATEY